MGRVGDSGAGRSAGETRAACHNNPPHQGGAGAVGGGEGVGAGGGSVGGLGRVGVGKRDLLLQPPACTQGGGQGGWWDQLPRTFPHPASAPRGSRSLGDTVSEANMPFGRSRVPAQAGLARRRAPSPGAADAAVAQSTSRQRIAAFIVCNLLATPQNQGKREMRMRGRPRLFTRPPAADGRRFQRCMAFPRSCPPRKVHECAWGIANSSPQEAPLLPPSGAHQQMDSNSSC